MTLPGGTRVLHVLASNDRRGAEVFGTDLNDALKDLGWSSDIVAVAASASAATVAARSLGTKLDVGVVRVLRRLARDHDVVIAHGSTALPACALACAGVAPFVYRSIGDPAHWSSTGVRRLQTGLLLSRSRKIVTLWDGAAHTLERRGIDGSRLAVIPNGVDSRRFPLATTAERARARSRLGIAADAKVVLYLGAFSREKCPERAVALGAANPGLDVVLVGDGPLRPELEATAREFVNVSVQAPSPDPRVYLAASDVLILPSATEGIPAAAIEAGLSGLPVVASAVGGMGSVVTEGVTGYLTQPFDDQELAERIDQALSAGPDMGKRAREHCLQRFDIKNVAQHWAALISQLVGDEPGQRS